MTMWIVIGIFTLFAAVWLVREFAHNWHDRQQQESRLRELGIVDFKAAERARRRSLRRRIG